MTIPIIPGPFAFLKGATDAGLDAYYRAQQRRDMLEQLKRQQDMQGMGLFFQMAPFMQEQMSPAMSAPLPLPFGQAQAPIPSQNLGLDTSGIAESYGRLTGSQVPRLGKTAQMRQQDVAAGVAEKTAGAAVRGANAEASLLEAKAELTEAEVAGLVQELRVMTPEQIRARGNIPGAAVAKLRETLDFEKAETEMLGQASQRQGFEVESAIQKEILKGLPLDENFRRVAKYAAVGGVGWLIAGLQNRSETDRLSIAQNRDQLQMFSNIETTARQAWTQEMARHDREKNDAVQGIISLMPEGSEKQKQKKMDARNNAIAEFNKLNPEPSYAKALDTVLNTHNVTREAYNKAFKTLVRIESGSSESTTISSSSSKPAEAAPATGSTMQAEIDAEIRVYNAKLASGEYDSTKLKAIFDSQLAKIKAKYAKP